MKPQSEASMMVYFRERINMDLVKKINLKMVKDFQSETESEENKKKEETKVEETKVEETKNKGKLILDATVAPADITHPYDLGILNQSRKQTEEIINFLHKNRKNKLDKKPRTYKNKARKDYLKVLIFLNCFGSFVRFFLSFFILNKTHELNPQRFLNETYVTSSLKAVKLIF